MVNVWVNQCNVSNIFQPTLSDDSKFGKLRNDEKSHKIISICPFKLWHRFSNCNCNCNLSADLPNFCWQKKKKKCLSNYVRVFLFFFHFSKLYGCFYLTLHLILMHRSKFAKSLANVRAVLHHFLANSGEGKEICSVLVLGDQKSQYPCFCRLVWGLRFEVWGLRFEVVKVDVLDRWLTI